jgi:hypothetical protein
MVGFPSKTLGRLLARMKKERPSAYERKLAKRGDEMSARIRARYDTSRKQATLTREFLREHGVQAEWNNGWDAFGR